MEPISIPRRHLERCITNVSNAVQNYKGLSRWAIYNGEYSKGTCTVKYECPSTNIV